MGAFVAVGLVLVAVALFVATLKKWIPAGVLEIGANVAGIVALLAAIALFIVPTAVPPEPRPGAAEVSPTGSFTGTASAASTLASSKPSLPTASARTSTRLTTTEPLEPKDSQDATPLPTPAAVPTVTITMATRLTYGAVITGEIKPSGDADAYTFEGQAGDMVVIVAVGTDEAPWLSLVIEVTDPYGNPVVEHSGGIYHLTTDGQHTLWIREPTTRTGPYVLKVGPGTEVRYGYATTKEIWPAGDVDAYSFEGQAGDLVLMALTDRSVNARCNVVMDLLDPKGQAIASGGVWVGNTAVVEKPLTDDGQYTVTIWATGQLNSLRTGTYTWLLNNISPPAGKRINYGDKVVGRIDPPGGVDIYTFEWNSGDMATVQVHLQEVDAKDAGYQCDFYVEVFDLERNSLAAGNGHFSLGDAEVSIKVKPLLSSDGIYAIAVGEKGQISGFCTASYTLSLETLATP